jgi:HD-like signal output (HDOD) protein
MAIELWELTRDANASMSSIVELVESDPATAGRILKFANSAFVGSRQKTADLRQALTLLGTRTAVSIALSLSIMERTKNGKCRNFDYDAFWSECTIRATTARQLAASPLNSNEAYTCGLLSQIGRLALASVYPEQYSGVLKNSQNSAVPGILTELERRMFEIDHVQLTVEMMADWQLPSYFREAVQAQAAPHKSTLEAGSIAAQLAHILHIGGHVVPLIEAAEVRREYFVNLLVAAHRRAIPRDEVPRLFDRIGREWHDAKDMLPIRTYEVPTWNTLYERSTVGGRNAALTTRSQAVAAKFFNGN